MFGFKTRRAEPIGTRRGTERTGEPLTGLFSRLFHRRKTRSDNPQVTIGSSRSQQARLIRNLREALRRKG